MVTDLLKPLIIVLILLESINIFAQKISIIGKVVEKTSKEPLNGATITLYQQMDSVIVTGVVTDSLGEFSLQSITAGSYFIEINFLGFIPYQINNFILTEDKNFGIINLEPSEILLDEVSVTAEKSTFLNSLDKKVYNVSKDILSESSSVSEILQNIPSVSVDINGGITLRNTGNITFFINGKPSAMLRRNAASVLAQMPANSIERIEIITNPSAKYRPDGIGGIINIILKQQNKQGFNGQIAANIGTEKRYNGNINLNYATERLNLFGNYGIRHSAGTYLSTDERFYKNAKNDVVNSRYNEKSNSNTDGLSHQIFAGANWEVNDYNNVALSGSYFFQNSLHKGNASIAAFDISNNPEYNFTNKETNDEFEGEGEANFAFEHIFKNKEDHTLTLEAAYSVFDEEEDLTFNQFYTFPNNFTDLSNILIQKGGDQTEIILDYALPIGEDAEFESGYAGEFVFEDIRYGRDGIANKFLFNQEIHAFYALYGQAIEDFSFKAGLRAEQTNITSHLKLPSDSLILNNYFKLFPTIHLGYELNDKEQISLSYSKRVNRPDSDELNPNPEFSDPRNAEAGNAKLKPEQTHSIELGYQTTGNKFTTSTILYYRYNYDAFTSVRSNIGDSIVLSTITNLNTRQSVGLEVVLSGNITKNWDFNITGNVYYTTIDAANLGFGSNKSAVSGDLKGYALIKWNKTTSLQLNTLLYFPAITPQGRRQPYFYANAGLKQQLFKSKASLILTATDIFHTYKIRRSIHSDELDQNTSYHRKLPVVYLGFTWRLNNYKEKEELKYEGDGLSR